MIDASAVMVLPNPIAERHVGGKTELRPCGPGRVARTAIKPAPSTRRDDMKKRLLGLRAWLCRSTALVGILSCGVGMSGSAFANLITDGSFEVPTTPAVPPGGFISVCTGSSFNGWDVVGAGVSRRSAVCLRALALAFRLKTGTFGLT